VQWWKVEGLKRSVEFTGFDHAISVLSSKVLESQTDGQSKPILLHTDLFEVPALIATKLLHLIPNQQRKSSAIPFKMKMQASLSLQHGWNFFGKN